MITTPESWVEVDPEMEENSTLITQIWSTMCLFLRQCGKRVIVQNCQREGFVWFCIPYKLQHSLDMNLKHHPDSKLKQSPSNPGVHYKFSMQVSISLQNLRKISSHSPFDTFGLKFWGICLGWTFGSFFWFPPTVSSLSYNSIHIFNHITLNGPRSKWYIFRKGHYFRDVL